MSTFENELISAAHGRMGSDRMALGLRCIPDRYRGDMEVVAVLRARVAELAAALREIDNYTEDFASKLVAHGALAGKEKG